MWDYTVNFLFLSGGPHSVFLVCPMGIFSNSNEACRTKELLLKIGSNEKELAQSSSLRSQGHREVYSKSACFQQQTIKKKERDITKPGTEKVCGIGILYHTKIREGWLHLFSVFFPNDFIKKKVSERCAFDSSLITCIFDISMLFSTREIRALGRSFKTMSLQSSIAE